MRDFPLFPTDSGVSSLILREIPYRGEAYVHIRDVQPGSLEEHLRECAAFCRMAGADRIYAAGADLEGICPLHCQVLEMRGTAWVDSQKLRSLFPVTEGTVSRWREVYNEKMRSVDNARTLEKRDETEILSSGGAYFVHDNGKLLGIGWLEDPKLRAVAAAERGAGEVVMHTLMSLLEGADMVLEVASTNTRAIRLYEKLNMIHTGICGCWYDISRISVDRYDL